MANCPVFERGPGRQGVRRGVSGSACTTAAATTSFDPATGAHGPPSAMRRLIGVAG